MRGRESVAGVRVPGLQLTASLAPGAGVLSFPKTEITSTLLVVARVASLPCVLPGLGMWEKWWAVLRRS